LLLVINYAFIFDLKKLGKVKIFTDAEDVEPILDFSAYSEAIVKIIKESPLFSCTIIYRNR